MQVIVTHQSIQDTNQCLDDYLKTKLKLLFEHVYVTSLFLQLFTISSLKEPPYMTCKFS